MISTGPDGIAVEVQVSVPADCSPDALHGSLVAAIGQAVTAYRTGTPIDVEVDDAWLSARVLD